MCRKSMASAWFKFIYCFAKKNNLLLLANKGTKDLGTSLSPKAWLVFVSAYVKPCPGCIEWCLASIRSHRKSGCFWCNLFLNVPIPRQLTKSTGLSTPGPKFPSPHQGKLEKVKYEFGSLLIQFSGKKPIEMHDD